MNSKLKASLVGLFVGVALLVVAACASSDTPPACLALEECCSSPNIGGAASSCFATATSGELTDAGCGQELAMYQSNGTCPVDAGSDAGIDAHD